MKYLRVKNWEKLQHQSDKPLPWIKFFTALLAPTKEPCYSEWSDQTKALLHHVWLMARVFNNRIPETWLTKEKLNLRSRVDLTPILDSGFAWFETENGERLDPSHARVARSGVLRSKPSAFDSQEQGSVLEFEALWGDYPRRIGRRQAQKHFLETVKTPEDLAAIRKALENYRAEVAGREMRYVQHGSTWFNSWREWVDYVPVLGPRAVHLESSGYGEIDDIREFARDLKDDLRGKTWERTDCTREEAAAYIEWLQSLPDLTDGAVRLEVWLKQRKTA